MLPDWPHSIVCKCMCVLPVLVLSQCTTTSAVCFLDLRGACHRSAGSRQAEKFAVQSSTESTG